MKIQSVLALVAAAGMASAASAQSFITTTGISATFSSTWIEDPSGPHNDNGLLETGEKALIITNLTFTGMDTSVDFSPAVGAFGSGVVLGLGAAYFDIRSSAGDASGLYNGGITNPTSTSVGPNNTGGTTGYGVRSGLRVGANAANGQPAANGFINVGPGQLPSDPSGVNVAGVSPINGLHRLGWTPNSYAARIQTFNLTGALGAGQTVVGLYLDFDGNTGGVAFIPLNRITFSSVNIPLAPAPASLALLGLGGLVAGRRRR